MASSTTIVCILLLSTLVGLFAYRRDGYGPGYRSGGGYSGGGYSGDSHQRGSRFRPGYDTPCCVNNTCAATTCAQMQCPRGQKCYMVDPAQCGTNTTCLPAPECRSRLYNPCANSPITCEVGQTCGSSDCESNNCTCHPCLPTPRCVLSSSPCQNVVCQAPQRCYLNQTNGCSTPPCPASAVCADPNPTCATPCQVGFQCVVRSSTCNNQFNTRRFSFFSFSRVQCVPVAVCVQTTG